MIDNTNKLNSYNYKENVLELIDQAMTANRAEGVCTCRYSENGKRGCNYCKILEGLMAAKACIVASVGGFDMIRMIMTIVQTDIEEKLRILPED